MDLIRLPIFARVVKLIKSAFNTCRTFFSSKKGNLLFTCLNFSFWLINFKADRRPLIKHRQFRIHLNWILLH
jgi:hypothetical protein